MTDTFDTTYQACLDDDAQRLYRLLSYHPGPDITPGPAAALIDTTEQTAADLLKVLVEFDLLQEQQDRYFFHDLAYDHACTTATKYESKDDPLGAFTRLAYWYLRRAEAGQRAVIPDLWHLGRVFTETRVVEFDEITALDWLGAERHNLLAIVDAAHKRHLHALASRVAAAAGTLFSRCRYYDTWVSMYEIGLEAARAAGDLEAQACMLHGQASAFLGLRHYSHAAALADQALEVARRSGHPHAEATSLEQLGLALLGCGEHAVATDHFGAARQIYRSMEDEPGTALMTQRLGEAALSAKDFHHAVELLIGAEQWYASRPAERYLRSCCLGQLGRAYRLVGRHEDALTALETALELARDSHAHQQQADVLVELADVAADLGKTDLEHRRLREAHTICTELGAPEAEAIADRLIPESE
ncbi:hypothetical protein GCM10029978_068280 [Actinoallomurus acanthiterrae]